MPTKHVTTRYIRFATRERPTDRFLTAQIRERQDKDDLSAGDLYFVVEIHNPWFPNSQIGQTIINTVVREFRRADSTSTLANFELALRKTNAVLAQITQTGETDWIGNLSSIVLLVADGHVYLAQTGRAHAFLWRNGRLSDITEGLEEEATHHPLTTYTNITSGILESADRVLITSSQVAETLLPADITELVSASALREAGREFIRSLQQHRARRVNGFLIEVDPPAETVSETVYTDEPVNNFLDGTVRLFHRHVNPLLHQSAETARKQATVAHAWTRDWLLPQLINWSGKTQQTIQKQAGRLLTKAKPAWDKTRRQAETIIPPGLRPPSDDTLAQEDLAGTTIYRVHHYQDNPAPAATRGTSRGTVAQLQLAWDWLHHRLGWPPVFLKRWRLSRLQTLLLVVAAIGIIFVITSALHRGANRFNQAQQTAAGDALASAQATQKQADRAFILGDKQAAKTDYAQAITLAEQANANADTQAAAAAVISASQNVLDQLINATRVQPGNPVTSFGQSVSQLTLSGDQLLSVSDDQIRQMSVTSPPAGTPAPTVPLPGPAAATNTAVVVNNSWFIPGAGTTVYRYDLTAKTVTTVTGAGSSWQQPAAVSSYGTTLYALEPSAGQIWKYPAKDATLAAPIGYLQTADPTGLQKAIGLAIDGNVYVLTTDGTVRKYTAGKPVTGWKLTNLPTPWDTLDQAVAIYADPAATHLYILTNKTADRPARFIEFDENGVFVRQLLLPDNWTVQTASFDPKTASGVVVVDQKAYAVSFPKS